jgi:hypothetical protein
VDEHRDIEARRKRLETKLKRLARAYVDVGLTDTEYAREKREIQAKLANIEVPHTKRVFDAGEVLESLGKVWQRANERERQEIVRLIFEIVYVDLDRQEITGLVLKPAFEPLFRIADEREDLTRLCEVGKRLYLEREHGDH